MIINQLAITGGSNTNVSPLLHPSEQPWLLNGCCNTWELGKITKDTGYSILGSQMEANKSVLGLYNFRQSSSTEKMLATMNDATDDDTQLFYRANGLGAWTEVAAAETQWANYAGINTEFESFLGYCFIVGFGAIDGYLPVGTLNGTTFGYIGDGSETNISDGASTANVTMPKAKFIKRYLDRLYVANCNTGSNEPFRIYSSDVPSSGTIAWDRTNNFLDVDYSDEITGFEEAWGKLIAFTDYKMWMYDLSTWKPAYDYGCSAHKTIKKHGPYMFWCNSDGVWVSTGGQPQNISGEIHSFFKAANPRNLFAEIVDEQYFLYLGDITVGGVGYSNLVAVFDIAKSIWWVRELGDSMATFGRYNASGKFRLYMGTTSGQVMHKGKYEDSPLLKSDNGADINSSFILAPFHLDSIDKFKKLNSIIAYADKPGGIKLSARVIDENSRVTTPFKPIGELTKYVNSFYVNVDDGVILQIAGNESGQNEYWSFLGYAMDILLSSDIPR